MSTTTHVPPVVGSRPAAATPVTTAPAAALSAAHVWGVARLAMAWIFLWPFFDKLLGLRHDTTSAQAWINGGNPTKGFLSGSVGPLSGLYQDLAGTPVVNVLFMVGLLAIGTGLALGVAMWPTCIAGVTMFLLMWSASLPPANNPFLDEHLVYAVLLVGLALVGAGRTFGLGERWRRTGLVVRRGWLA